MIASVVILIIFAMVIATTYIFSKLLKTKDYEIPFYLALTIVILIVFLIEEVIR